MANLSWQLSRELFAEVIAPYLIQGGRCTNEYWGEPRETRLLPSQVLAVTLMRKLIRKPYVHGLLATDIHARRRGDLEMLKGELDGASLKDVSNHMVDEARIYIQVLFRRVTLTSPSTGQTVVGQTNAHRFLLAVLHAASPQWAAAKLVRHPTENLVLDKSIARDAKLKHVVDFLSALYRAEQDGHMAARDRGEDWNFGQGSVSASWIEGRSTEGPRPSGTWGILHLDLGGTICPIPEEMGLPDALNCLPGPMAAQVLQDFQDGCALVEGADGKAGDREISAAEKEMAASLPPGYQLWRLFRTCIENLNDPYGAMVKAGLPSSATFNLTEGYKLQYSFREMEVLTLLREGAHAIRKAEGRTEITDEHWMQSWETLARAGKLKGSFGRDKYGGFAGFRHSAEGSILLNLPELRAANDTDDEDDDGVPLPATDPEVEREDLPHLIAVWARDGAMTASELALADHVGFDATPPACGDEVPYKLLPPGPDREVVLRFFFGRRYCLLTDVGCTRKGKGWKVIPSGQWDMVLTKAEQVTLDIVNELNQKAGFPDRNHSGALQVQILARLRTDTRLARALNEFPYNLAPLQNRLRLMLFFYTRDVEDLLCRPA